MNTSASVVNKAQASKAAKQKKHLGPRPDTMKVAMVFCLHESVSITVVLEKAGGGRDYRGRWDKVQWPHYRRLAEGLSEVIALMLDLPRSEVTINGSFLCSETAALPRLIVEVPMQCKERLLSPAVQDAIRQFTDLVMGRAPAATPQAACEPKPASREGEEVPAATTARTVEAVAAQVLARVGGATLPFPCRIQIEGCADTVAVVAGKCADKPPLIPSEPTEHTMKCFVEGFHRTKHEVYLVTCDSNGVAKDVAFPEELEDMIVGYAMVRGRRFSAVFNELRLGTTTLRELIELTPLDEAKPLAAMPQLLKAA